ncbi:MAG: serine/threonine protein kinase [Planctomycetes bacterium]|nr:serine/threonine protein kinase [Planctomycetota bacterium]
MVTTELGACEWFVWDLRRSNLVERGQLDQVVGEFIAKNPRSEPPALAEYLIQQGILTPFQSERLLQGKTQGFVLGPFTLMDALGAGSMGTVYKAQSKTDNKAYAVKVLPRRSMWNVRLARRKVRAFEQCRHPAVIPFVDVGTAGGMHYLAWPFVEGETLEKVAQQQGKMSAGQAAWIALQVAEGLDVCHQQGLFHGLLKPSNIMLGPDGRVHILDFGIGTLLAETEGESLVDTMSTSNSVTSGLDCASPESIMDPTNLTPAGDQYSLGCVLYFLLAGQYPFPEGNAAEKMMAHQFKQPTPIAELSPETPAGLIEVVERLMQKAPEGRYQRVVDVVDALKPLAINPSKSKPVRARSGILPMQRPGIPSIPDKQHAPAPSMQRAAGKETVRVSAGAVGPATPTPRPAALDKLPNRRSMRGAQDAKSAMPATPKVKATPKPPAQREDDSEAREVPGMVDARLTFEDRLGPVGITIGAIAACALVWVLAVVLKLF